MGKRVNLAALAEDDFYEPPAPLASVVAEPAPAENSLGDSLVRTVDLDSVCPNPLNKRHSGADDQLREMAETIRAHGLIQPLVVCSATAYVAAFPEQRKAIGGAEWVALIGNRRLHAARLAGLGEVPILVNDDQVASMYEVMLVENGQRRDLPPVLEAEAISEAVAASGVSQAELARRIGKSGAYVTQRLTLLRLIPELRELVDSGALRIEDARQLGDLGHDDQRAVFEAGPPYRRLRPIGKTRARPISIRVTSPAVAAESIRARFTREETTELVSLLTKHLAEPNDSSA